ncbi:hypothetical protein XC64_00995, partial [Klebsiella pneumoniae]|nr:hypothetical protein [Klebsiella pneumoniae]
IFFAKLLNCLAGSHAIFTVNNIDHPLEILSEINFSQGISAITRAFSDHVINERAAGPKCTRGNIMLMRLRGEISPRCITEAEENIANLLEITLHLFIISESLIAESVPFLCSRGDN